MTVREHFCDDHPDGRGWQPGGVAECPFHKSHSGQKQLGYRDGRKARAKADKQAGVIGDDRGGYISGR